jgi:hypothetical protein
MVLKKAQSTVGVPASELEKLKNLPAGDKNNSGLSNTSIVEAVPNFNQTAAETVYKGKHNSYIVMGRDRPRDIQSGYGGIGVTQCGTIDLVVGLGGATGVEVNEQNQSVYTDKSPELDSARIYISQRTDVDDNFGLPEGKVGNSTNKSAVAVKADAVRLVARDGIKLVTGTDVYDGQGVRIDIQEGIDLIAGNNDEGLQPLVKGSNLQEALREIIDLIADLNGAVTSMAMMYFYLLNNLVLHTHITTVPGSPTTPSIDFAAIAAPIQYPQLIKLFLDLGIHQKNTVSTKLDYTYETGGGYINSLFNNTN